MKNYNLTNFINSKSFFFIFMLTLCLHSCKKDNISENKTATQSNIILAIGEQATILRSNDQGKTFTQSNLELNERKFNGNVINVSTNIVDAAYGQNKWIAVGGYSSDVVNFSALLLSEDKGVSFKEIKVPTKTKLTAITYLNGKFYAGGSVKDFICSADGVKWEKIELPNILGENETNAKSEIFKIYGKGNTLILSGQIDFNDGHANAFYPFVLESTDAGKTWNKIKEVSGVGYTNIIHYKDQILLLGKSSVLTKQANNWSLDIRSGMPKIQSPAITNGTKCFAVNQFKGSTKIAVYENSEWKILENSVFNFNYEDMMYKDGKILLIGYHNPPNGKPNSGARVFLVDENKLEWEFGAENIKEQYLGFKNVFRNGLVYKDHFLMISGKKGFFNPAPNQILYSKDGLNWEASSLPNITKKQVLNKIIK